MTLPRNHERLEAPTFLIVDDTPMNLSVLLRILEGSGYRILVARNGRAALEIARRTHPDLMLLDVAMPDMSGFDVCRTLKQDGASFETIVIFLSALGELADKVSGLELGAADYITKPFQSEEVLARVRGHLLRKQLERDLRLSRDSLAEEMQSTGEMQRMLLPQTLHLPFELLSDSSFAFAQALRLPMFEVEGRRLLKRVTLIAKDGKIAKHFYPVFPPDRNIDDVLAWLQANGT
jgi:DNA-binding response OmpR family regulator